MKKLLALMLAAALALSLVACGGGGGAGDTNTPNGGNGDTTGTDTPSGGMTKEEMLEQAEVIRLGEIYSAAYSNKVNAEETYMGNIYAFAGRVETIESDYIELYNAPTNMITKVYLSTDDIKQLNTNTWIEVVGEISAVDYKQSTGEYGVEFERGVEVTNAYFVTDIFEISGRLGKKIVNGVPMSWQIILDDDTANSIFITSLYEETLSLEKEIPLIIGENTVIISDTEVKDGDSIIISCKITTPDLLRDVTLVSIN